MTAKETAGDTGTETAAPQDGTNRVLRLAPPLGTFSIGTDSLIISGLLDRIATDREVSQATTGQLISVFALVYAIGAPVLAAVTGALGRKRLLLIALTVFIAANLLGALAPGYPALM